MSKKNTHTALSEGKGKQPRFNAAITEEELKLALAGCETWDSARPVVLDLLAKKSGEGTVDTYVPFRNGLFLSFAAAVAVSVGAEVIYYGAHADDAAGRAYPDCTPEFETAMNTAIYEGSGRTCHLEAPLLSWNKAGVVKEGLRLGAPYELTWSCYEGGDKPCGVCGTCRDRAAAFAANGVKDPALS